MGSIGPEESLPSPLCYVTVPSCSLPIFPSIDRHQLFLGPLFFAFSVGFILRPASWCWYIYIYIHTINFFPHVRQSVYYFDVR